MITTPSRKRSAKPGKRRTSNAAPGLVEADPALLGGYQRQLCELEWKVSSLRSQVGELQSALAESRESSQSWANLFEAAPVAYLLLDEHGFIQELNQQAATLLGVKRSQAVRSTLARFVLKNETSFVLAHFRECKATRQESTVQIHLQSPAGRIIPVQMITAPVQTLIFEPVKQFRTILIDVADRQVAEAALAKTQMNYHRLVDTVEGIVWEADASTFEISFVSRSAERLLGYTIEQWRQPRFWVNHIYAEDRERVANLLARSVDLHQPLVVEYRVLTSARTMLWLHDTITLTDYEGRPKLLGVAIDITERKKAEQELESSQEELERRVEDRTARLRETVAELEAFSYSLSHDMRAPLRAMQGYAQLLLNLLGAKSDARVRDYLTRIISSTERLDALVQDVLQYSRVSRAPLELKPVNLEKVVQTIISDYPALQPPHARIEVQKPLLPVFGHEIFLSQCVSNLLSNAVKFTRRGETPRVRISSRLDRHDVRVCFEDNGIGIAPEDQRRIFGIFQRVHPAEKYEGTGIGLAIVQKAVERMGGRVGVESVPGQGSKFWLQLQRVAV